MDFSCPLPVVLIRGRVGDLSFFLWLFFGSHFGWFLGPKGTPKSIKNRFFAKKGTLGSSFLTIFAARGVFLDFFHRFSCDFSLKIDVFSNVFSLLIACFFDRGDPCDSVVFTIRKLLFHISRFFFFPTKITKKSTWKHGPKKSSKNDSPGIHFGVQNRWKSTPEARKSA